MTDFNVRSDSVNVEQIMEQIRARVREKRGVDYTEQQIRELATVKLEKFLDPRGVRSSLLEEFLRSQAQTPAAPPNYAFTDQTLYDSHRAPVRWIRRLLNPILKLFFNPRPLIQALHVQAQLNTLNAEHDPARRSFVQLQYEVLHNLVIEATRTGIEVKNLRMRVESLASRLEFSERRTRALESVVVYKPTDEEGERERTATPRQEAAEGGGTHREVVPLTAAGQAAVDAAPEGPGQRSRRRRRRRGRRGAGSAAARMAQPAGPGQTPATGQGVDRSTADAEGVRAEPVDARPSIPSTAPEPAAGGAGPDSSAGSGQDDSQ